MKIFLDTADTEAIKKGYETGLVDGITTNPSLIMKSGRDPEEVYKELIDLGIPDISMEVVGNREQMLWEGRRLANKFGQHSTIKVPCTPDGLLACKALSDESIRVNVTLIFSVAQAVLAAKAGAKYVSPFVGRLDDNSHNGVELIAQIAGLYNQQMIRTEVLAASLRDVPSVSKCFGVGSDIVTMPPSVFEKMYKHVLTDKGLDQFDKDYAASIGE